MAARLMAAAPLPVQHEGFAPEEGVAANILLVQEIIKNATAHNKSLSISFIDFKESLRLGYPKCALYAKTGHGFGVPSFRSNVPAQKRGALERLSKSSDSRVARIAGALLLNPLRNYSRPMLRPCKTRYMGPLMAGTSQGRTVFRPTMSGKHHGNENNKQQHCNAPQNVSLVQSNYHIRKPPCRSFYRDRTNNMRNTEEGEKQNASP
ncbi:hypothetical protein E2C01_061945 [Portunus trituberculatus]|uniref:Uncharacterized protein n=1 Tax=Portunus trituberculatus TaxID=210409 RepID=A0A5B7H9N1_PORTR|nr:hypothetical protein [Portunus trituberculatus]